LNRKAESIVVAAMLAYGRQIANAQGVILQQILLVFGEGEQRFALCGGQESTAGHETILTMDYAFEKPLSLLSDPPPQP
jgi:hypothetical protein